MSVAQSFRPDDSWIRYHSPVSPSAPQTDPAEVFVTPRSTVTSNDSEEVSTSTRGIRVENVVPTLDTSTDEVLKKTSESDPACVTGTETFVTPRATPTEKVSTNATSSEQVSKVKNIVAPRATLTSEDRTHQLPALIPDATANDVPETLESLEEGTAINSWRRFQLLTLGLLKTVASLFPTLGFSGDSEVTPNRSDAPVVDQERNSMQHRSGNKTQELDQYVRLVKMGENEYVILSHFQDKAVGQNTLTQEADSGGKQERRGERTRAFGFLSCFKKQI